MADLNSRLHITSMTVSEGLYFSLFLWLWFCEKLNQFVIFEWIHHRPCRLRQKVTLLKFMGLYSSRTCWFNHFLSLFINFYFNFFFASFFFFFCFIRGTIRIFFLTNILFLNLAYSFCILHRFVLLLYFYVDCNMSSNFSPLYLKKKCIFWYSIFY